MWSVWHHQQKVSPDEDCADFGLGPQPCQVEQLIITSGLQVDAFRGVFETMLQQKRETNAKECRCKDTPLFNPTLDCEGLRDFPVEGHNTLHVLMKESDNAVQLWGGGTTDLLQQLEQTLPTHKVKCLGEVDEGDVERHLLVTTLLLKLSNGEDHVHCGSLASEAALGFWVDALCKDQESD